MNSDLAACPVVTLTTDFGLADHYVGTMKGVILSRCPQATLIDITHQIPPFGVLAAGYALAQTAPFFPAGTVHLAVVDPGVGTARRPLAVSAGGQIYIAPDNGLLHMALHRKEFEAFHISNPAVIGESPSKTFHGRDIFAPAAAAMASGCIPIDHLGPRVKDLVAQENLRAHRLEDDCWRGCILSIDQFGNVITNFEVSDHSGIIAARFRLTIGATRVETFRATFGEAAPEEMFAYFGSSGFIEIGVNQASAAALLGVKPGDVLELTSVNSRGTLKE